MYPFVVHIEYYETPCQTKTTNILTYARNFTEIAEQMEKYFGDLLESITIHIVGDDISYFEVPDGLAAKFIEKEGDIR